MTRHGFVEVPVRQSLDALENLSSSPAQVSCSIKGRRSNASPLGVLHEGLNTSEGIVGFTLFLRHGSSMTPLNGGLRKEFSRLLLL